MFNPINPKIQSLVKKYPAVIAELDTLFTGRVHTYIDYANVRPWAVKLGWHVDPKRLKQFLKAFSSVGPIKFYFGTLAGDKDSESFVKGLHKLKYDVKTKPVKIMKFSIDTTSINRQSTDLVRQFIRTCLIRKYDVATIEYLNDRFTDLNKRGELYIEDRKCNFDVEIGRDMLLDYGLKVVDTFVLWSGDSDFADPIRQLLKDGKKVILFATARRVAAELNDLRKDGLVIFDIQKIRNFICWKSEIQP